MIKLLYQPVSMLVSVLGGMPAGPSCDCRGAGIDQCSHAVESENPVAAVSAMITAAPTAGPAGGSGPVTITAAWITPGPAHGTSFQPRADAPPHWSACGPWRTPPPRPTWCACR
jgi:hypothetical protein